MRTARVRAGQDLVLGEVRRQRRRPVHVRVEFDQRRPVARRGQLDAPEQRVAHQHSKRAGVRGDRRRLLIERVCRLHDHIAAGETLPLVEQARVGLADQLAKPVDDVLELLAVRDVGGTVCRKVR